MRYPDVWRSALNAAAILLEPKVKAVNVEKALLKTADDVWHWAERQQKALLEALRKVLSRFNNYAKSF